MPAKLVTRLMNALTTKKGGSIAAAVLIAGGLTVLAGAPALSTASNLQLAQAGGSQQPPATPNTSGPFSAEQKQAIEQIIKDYLLRNPEILVEVSRELEKRQAAQQAAEQKRVLLENRDKIFSSSADFVLGNPNGDITVVEFFDYNCPYCKRALPELMELVKSDSNIKVVFKEFPILGEGSVSAAKAAMASLRQGKYLEFHMALMQARQVNEDNLFKIAERVGLDVDRLKKDMVSPEIDAAIKQTSDIAQELGITGTPVFIVDATVNVGLLRHEELSQLVNEARKAGCQVC